MFSSRWASDDVPGMGSMTGDFLQQPRERELHHADVATFRFGFQRITGLAQRGVPTAANRRPRNKSHLFLFAVVERGFRLAVSDVVLVLDTDNRHDLFTLLDLRDRHLR